MKLTRHEFLQLQETWYEKLAESGFEDIEKFYRGELVLKESSIRAYKNCVDLAQIESREEYYRWIAQQTHDEEVVFRNETDRYILTRRSEGARINEIESELAMAARGGQRKRWAIWNIIKTYEAQWQWKKRK